LYEFDHLCSSPTLQLGKHQNDKTNRRLIYWVIKNNNNVNNNNQTVDIEPYKTQKCIHLISSMITRYAHDGDFCQNVCILFVLYEIVVFEQIFGNLSPHAV